MAVNSTFGADAVTDENVSHIKVQNFENNDTVERNSKIICGMINVALFSQWLQLSPHLIFIDYLHHTSDQNRKF